MSETELPSFNASPNGRVYAMLAEFIRVELGAVRADLKSLDAGQVNIDKRLAAIETLAATLAADSLRIRTLEDWRLERETREAALKDEAQKAARQSGRLWGLVMGAPGLLGAILLIWDRVTPG